jgi:hypothetical protein
MGGGSVRGLMSLRRLVPVLVLAAVLLVPSPSWSHGSSASNASLTGTIKIFTGGIDVSVTNNGPDSTNWVWIRMVPSVHHTGATMDGGGCGPGGDANTVRCGIGAPGFQVGSTHVVRIMTDGPYPPNGAQLFTSEIFSGPPVPAGTATGPAPSAPPPPPPPAAKPCTCASLTARIVGSSLKFESEGSSSFQLEMTLHWVLGCTKGNGGCKGRLQVHAPQQRANPKQGDEGYRTKWITSDAHAPYVWVDCKGPCGRVSEGGKALTLEAENGLGPDARAHESIPIVIDVYCGEKAPTVSKRTRIRLSIAFGANGKLDVAKSKLR